MLRILPCLLLIAVAAAQPAAAQFVQPQPQQPPCMKDFMPLRDDTEKKAAAVREASKRHASPQEACQLFNALVAAQVKLTKFAEANATWCGIPQQIVQQIKAGYNQTNGVRTKVCAIAARPAAPSGPSLSDALGTNRVADPSNIKTGRGTFDTLTGTPLGSK